MTRGETSHRAGAWALLAALLCLAMPVRLPASSAAASAGPAQGRLGRAAPGEVDALAAGKLLVASRDLRDPNFAAAVVLLVDYDKAGAAGVIVNVRTGVPLSRLFGNLDLGVNAGQSSFAGGPVSADSVLALVRSRTSIDGARPVTSEIQLIATREPLERTLTAGADPERVRVYRGHAGWGPGQLDRETIAGAWHVFAGDERMVFDPDPTTVWRRLIRRAELLQASVRQTVNQRIDAQLVRLVRL